MRHTFVVVSMLTGLIVSSGCASLNRKETGAIIGGAAGTGTVLATKGKEVEFDSESKLKFTLDQDASIPMNDPNSVF